MSVVPKRPARRGTRRCRLCSRFLRLGPSVPTRTVMSGGAGRCVVFAAVSAATVFVLLRFGWVVHLSVLIRFGHCGVWIVCCDGDSGVAGDCAPQAVLDGGGVEVGRRVDGVLVRVPSRAGRGGCEFMSEAGVPFSRTVRWSRIVPSHRTIQCESRFQAKGPSLRSWTRSRSFAVGVISRGRIGIGSRTPRVLGRAGAACVWRAVRGRGRG